MENYLVASKYSGRWYTVDLSVGGPCRTGEGTLPYAVRPIGAHPHRGAWACSSALTPRGRAMMPMMPTMPTMLCSSGSMLGILAVCHSTTIQRQRCIPPRELVTTCLAPSLSQPNIEHHTS